MLWSENVLTKGVNEILRLIHKTKQNNEMLKLRIST